MEYKIVILSVFIMSLVLVQIQVEAKACCPSRRARNVYTVCRFTGTLEVCCQQSGCKSVPERSTCPPGYPDDILENSGDAINEYCNLGCVSSVCGALTTLQNSDASETVNEAVEKFTKACSTLCTKGSTTVVKTA